MCPPLPCSYLTSNSSRTVSVVLHFVSPVLAHTGAQQIFAEPNRIQMNKKCPQMCECRDNVNSSLRICFLVFVGPVVC